VLPGGQNIFHPILVTWKLYNVSSKEVPYLFEKTRF
jgi:hypothetical protein